MREADCMLLSHVAKACLKDLRFTRFRPTCREFVQCLQCTDHLSQTLQSLCHLFIAIWASEVS